MRRARGRSHSGASRRAGPIFAANGQGSAAGGFGDGLDQGCREECPGPFGRRSRVAQMLGHQFGQAGSAGLPTGPGSARPGHARGVGLGLCWDWFGGLVDRCSGRWPWYSDRRASTPDAPGGVSRSDPGRRPARIISGVRLLIRIAVVPILAAGASAAPGRVATCTYSNSWHSAPVGVMDYPGSLGDTKA